MKIAQIGTFDVENYGDLLFPTVLKEKYKDIKIDIFSPKGGKKPFEENIIVYPLDKLDYMCNIEKYNALIIGGGDLIRLDDKVATVYKQSFDTSLSIWQLPVILGKKYNIPVIFNSPGVPYYFNHNQRKIISKILKDVDYISVRDNESRKILEKCGVKNIKVVPDTILCIDEIISIEDLKKEKNQLEDSNKIPKVENYIAFQHNISNINNDYYIEKLKELIELIINKYNYNILFIPIGYVHNDIKFLEKIYDKNNEKQFIIKNKLSPKEMLSVFACSKGYIGTSMHGAITTYSYDNPIMVLDIKKLVKIDGFLEQIDKKNVAVHNISDACNIFEKNFFAKNIEHKKVKEKINNHFFKMKNVINEYSKKNVYNYEKNILTEVYNELSKFNDNQFEFASIYLDFGKGFQEEIKKNIELKFKENNISLECDIQNSIKRLRIDLIEGRYIKYKNIKISLDGVETSYFIPNIKKIGEYNYICTTDPQIYINVNNNCKLEMTLECYIIDNNEMDYLLSKFIESEKNYNNKISVLNSQLNEIRRNYKKTIRYFLQKLKRKLTKN